MHGDQSYAQLGEMSFHDERRHSSRTPNFWKGHEVDKAKIESIEKLPPPTLVMGVHSFLGHDSFYRRFIREFSKLSSPLSTLLIHGIPFDVDDTSVKAFATQKEKLIPAPIISTPDWELKFELMCDTRDYADGTILGQRKNKIFHAIYYANRTLNDAELNNATNTKKKNSYWPLCLPSKNLDPILSGIKS